MFTPLWLFIIVVSVIDAHLVVEHRNHLEELNPQGQLLIALNDGGVWLLLIAKYLGTVVAATLLQVIYENSPRLGGKVVVGVALLQFCLLMFLLLV